MFARITLIGYLLQGNYILLINQSYHNLQLLQSVWLLIGCLLLKYVVSILLRHSRELELIWTYNVG